MLYHFTEGKYNISTIGIGLSSHTSLVKTKKTKKLFHVIPVIIPDRVAQPQPVKSLPVKCVCMPLVGAWLSVANECL